MIITITFLRHTEGRKIELSHDVAKAYPHRDLEVIRDSHVVGVTIVDPYLKSHERKFSRVTGMSGQGLTYKQTLEQATLKYRTLLLCGDLYWLWEVVE